MKTFLPLLILGIMALTLGGVMLFRVSKPLGLLFIAAGITLISTGLVLHLSKPPARRNTNPGDHAG